MEANANTVVHVETNKDRLSALYQRLYLTAAPSNGMAHCINKLLDKLENIGYLVNEDDKIISIGVPEDVKLDFTRSDLKAAKHVILEAIKPGSRLQAPQGVVRTKFLPLASDLGMRSLIEKEVYSGGDSETKDVLLDREMETDKEQK